MVDTQIRARGITNPRILEAMSKIPRHLFVEEALAEPFKGVLSKGYELVTIGGRKVFVLGTPATLYRNVRDAIGFAKKLDYLPFEP